MDIKQLLKTAVNKNASDLHLTVGVPPILRIEGILVPIDMEILTPEISKELIYSILNESQRAQFEKNLELDFALSIKGLSRFRANIHMEKNNLGATFRVILSKIKTIQELGLPPIIASLVHKPNGLILVTGPTGVGKSTTLAAMVDLINQIRNCMIITIEDPIEYLFEHKKSIIKQREVHTDTKSFANALRHVLRQDPDVILVGEMRDLETISTALTAAETGHLVISTLHTPDAAQSIDRIIDVFPPYQQQQIKIQLASSLQAIISQDLLPRADGNGRVAVTEILTVTSAVRHIIREHKVEQLPSVMQTGASFGMHTMDGCLKHFYKKNIITYETALRRIKEPEGLKSQDEDDKN
jgi:twitching motility protein PilT